MRYDNNYQKPLGNLERKGGVQIERSADMVTQTKRKTSLNRNRFGSVRKMNGKVYVDFMYLEERVRESSNLPWNADNAKIVRQQLDRIGVAIQTGDFSFSKTFSQSKKKDFFLEKERVVLNRKCLPEQVKVGEELTKWLALQKDTKRLTERTQSDYARIIRLYLFPFFEEKTFEDLSPALFDEFISWVRSRKYKGKEVSNPTINKTFLPLRLLWKHLAGKHRWGSETSPFEHFQKLQEVAMHEQISPFSIEEQRKIIAALPEHWKPFFEVAFATGMRQGEQLALKPENIDWEKKLLYIKGAITRDFEGKRILGNAKNRYSRRTIKLIPPMLEALKHQKVIWERYQSEYFFCTTTGFPVESNTLRTRVWKPTLEKAGVPYRPIRQTRHSLATLALSCGESPLWIAKVLGHANTEMVIKVYCRFLEDITGEHDGEKLSQLF